ncbi:MAG: UpxY family transcription antiterminator [Candidatus Acidiferrum sp.]
MQSGVCEFQQSRAELEQSAWYAVYTKHQHEKSATELLSKKGFEVFLPLYSARHQWKDRAKNVLLPVFPCYLFLRTNLHRKLDILRTPGVFWLVENGGHACPVPDSDIEAVRRIVQSPREVKPHPFLKSGDRVRVLVGPLAGVEGILTRFKNGYRVVLSVDLLQKAVAVEVDISIVKPVVGANGKSLSNTKDARQIA